MIRIGSRVTSIFDIGRGIGTVVAVHEVNGAWYVEFPHEPRVGRWERDLKLELTAFEQRIVKYCDKELGR